MIVNTKGLMERFSLFGEDMDFPEDGKLYLSNKVKPYFDEVDIDMEEIEDALWKNGNKALNSSFRYVVIYKNGTQDFVGLSIDIDNNEDGFFFAIQYCQSSIQLSAVLEEECPVIII